LTNVGGDFDESRLWRDRIELVSPQPVGSNLPTHDFVEKPHPAIQDSIRQQKRPVLWIPAFAGMTKRIRCHSGLDPESRKVRLHGFLLPQE
jgi:hypothetical protein